MAGFDSEKLKNVNLTPCLGSGTLLSVFMTNNATMGSPENLTNNSTSETPKFAHPSEAEFASLLDYYGIPWQYEPHTFVLEEDEEGHPIEAFSPDFYLPEQDLYVETTTMRQKLITKKNGKVRRLRERYPHINIKLFTRNDFQTLLAGWGMIERHDELIGQAALNHESKDPAD